jgi:hypothetical protein
MRIKMATMPEIFDMLFERSKEGKLDWTRLSSGSFYVNVGENAVSLDRSSNDEYGMTVQNSEGITVGRLRFSSDEGKEKAKELYEIARRRALRVDETFDKIKEALDRL